MDRPTLDDFGRRPRESLMWPPRALDVARIAAVLHVAGPRVVDVGAGTGLLAALLTERGVDVEAVDPTPPEKRYHRVRTLAASDLDRPCDAAIVSWMEAGRDYRDAVARVSPVIVNIYDVEGGCGVMGATGFPDHLEAASWRTPSFEDVEHALTHRGLPRKGHPGNRIDVLTRDAALVGPLCDALLHAQAEAPYPWEREMDALGL